MFDQNDIEEMAAVLQVYPHCMYRPEKIRKIFASWACRSSIMIGKALKEYEMKRVVVNMGKIENPWVSEKISTIFIKHYFRIVHMAVRLSVTWLSSNFR